MVFTAGRPQGTVLGPLLSNIMYDEVLVLGVPKEAILVGFADDLAVVVVAKHYQEMELYASETIHAIKAWLEMVKLDLTEYKTEAVLITNRTKSNIDKIRLDNHEVVSKSTIGYLGVMTDVKLSFKGKGHLDLCARKGSKA